MDKKKLDLLMNKMKNGDQGALGELYDMTYLDIYKYIYSITKSSELAQDLTHDVFIQAYKNAPSYSNKGHAMAWLITLSRNLTYMYLRKSNRTVLLDEPIEQSDDSMDQVNNSILFKTIINELEEIDREIIVLHIVEELTFNEISKILNINLSTVLSRYHRCIKKLKVKYGGV